MGRDKGGGGGYMRTCGLREWSGLGSGNERERKEVCYIEGLWGKCKKKIK